MNFRFYTSYVPLLTELLPYVFIFRVYLLSHYTADSCRTSTDGWLYNDKGRVFLVNEQFSSTYRYHLSLLLFFICYYPPLLLLLNCYLMGLCVLNPSFFLEGLFLF